VVKLLRAGWQLRGGCKQLVVLVVMLVVSLLVQKIGKVVEGRYSGCNSFLENSGGSWHLECQERRVAFSNMPFLSIKFLSFSSILLLLP
jgi:hypothetical protein